MQKSNFRVVHYETNDDELNKYFSTKVIVFYAETFDDIKKRIAEDYKFFEDDTVKIINHSVRRATNDEIKYYLQNECDENELFAMLLDLLKIETFR